jgi:hypothetical protein
MKDSERDFSVLFPGSSNILRENNLPNICKAAERFLHFGPAANPNSAERYVMSEYFMGRDLEGSDRDLI